MARELLRFATAGSVDDGKSTLIGRLLYDAKLLCDDQLAALDDDTDRGWSYGGRDEPNLALLTDGLRAEREQGITIDVAYRYFATPRRKFVVADTPGHLQYTRNMVTGASQADLALVLTDASKGLTEQSRRHAVLASLLRVPHLVLCVNKMDLVDYDQRVFERIAGQFRAFAARLDIADLTMIAISALRGDNVVGRSPEMGWYEGPTLLRHLEEVYVGSDRNLIDARFPVQLVLPPPRSEAANGRRRYAGTVAGGVFRPGDEIMVLPSRHTSRVAAIDAAGAPLAEAFAPQSVSLQLTDELDVARGDLICRVNNQPRSTNQLEVMLCWFDNEQSLDSTRTYLVKHTTRWTPARIERLQYRLDVNTLHRDQAATTLAANEIGRVTLHSTRPLFVDAYRSNRAMGSLILVDEASGATVAAGIVLDATSSGSGSQVGSGSGPARQHARPPADVTFHPGLVSREQRWNALGASGATVWLTGLSGSGKSTLAAEVETRLVARGRPTLVLDGDNLRHGLTADLGFSEEDRAENVRRVAEVARLAADAGLVVLVALISPARQARERARHLHVGADLPFHEVYVATPLEVCEQRDPKGLYARARNGQLAGLTGVSSPYEPPLAPELTLDGSDLAASVEAILALLNVDQRAGGA